MKVIIQRKPEGFKYSIKCEQVKITRGEFALVLDAEQAAQHGLLLLEEGFESFKPNALEHIYFLRHGTKDLADMGIINIC